MPRPQVCRTLDACGCLMYTIEWCCYAVAGANFTVSFSLTAISTSKPQYSIMGNASTVRGQASALYCCCWLLTQIGLAHLHVAHRLCTCTQICRCRRVAYSRQFSLSPPSFLLTSARRTPFRMPPWREYTLPMTSTNFLHAYSLTISCFVSFAFAPTGSPLPELTRSM